MRDDGGTVGGRRGRGGPGRGLAAGVSVAALVAVTAACGGGGSDDRPPAGTGDAAAPVAFEDHWHAAFGVYVCDGFLPPAPEFESAAGIHTHGDGVIHIHPFTEQAAGDGARLGRFLDGAGIDVSGDALTVDGRTYTSGEDTCGGEPAEVAVLRWADVAADDAPEVVDVDDARFRRDGEGYVVAFAPPDAVAPRPETADRLSELGSVDGAPTGASTAPSAVTPTTRDAGSGDGGAAGALADGFYAVEEAGPPPPCGPGRLADPEGVACYLLADDAAVGTDAVDSAEASPALVRTDGQEAWQVDLVLTEDGIEAFNTAAAACYDRLAACPLGQLALVVDGEVVFAPAVQEPSFDRDAISVSGDYDEDQARALATTLAGD